MPRAYRRRRQEVRNSRRRARRSLHQLMLDDEVSLLDELDTANPFYDLVLRRYGRDSRPALEAAAERDNFS